MKKIFNLSIILFVIFSVFFTGVSLTENRSEAFASTNYSSYSELVNSYADFSNDYTGDPLPFGYCMRDEYMVYTEQQASMGLCWAFTSSKVASTTIMKQTGEYVDFSEAWISTALTYADKYESLHNYNVITSSDYYNGDGGWFIGFDQVAKEYGQVLEEDFEYENGFTVSMANVDSYYEMFSKYATKNYINKLSAGKFSRYIGNTNKTQIINSMKEHILDNGAIYAGLEFGEIKTAEYKNKNVYYKQPAVTTHSGHAVTLIGWDDNISVYDNGKTYTGAWIALNSWGNMVDESYGDQGIIYVLYDDTNFNDSCYAYKYDKDKELVYSDEISDSTASYYTTLKGEYHTNFKADTTPNKTKQKNIFFEQSDIDITYSYNLLSGGSITNIGVFKAGVDETNKFLITKNETNINIKGTNISTGAYKVQIEYTDGICEDVHLNQFFVCDGTELNFMFYLDMDETFVKNNGTYQLFNTFYSPSEEIIFATETSVGELGFRFVFATYNKINYFKFGANKHSVANQTFSAIIDYDLSVKSEYNFEFVTSEEKTSTIKLKIYLITSENASTNILTNVFYDADGGDNSSNSKKLIINKSNGAKLNAPTKQDYIFEGWYYNSNFSEDSKLRMVGQDYYIDYNKVLIEDNPLIGETVNASFNYWQQFSTVFVYAKWKSAYVTVTFETNGGSLVSPISTIIGSKITPQTTVKNGFIFDDWYTDEKFKTKWDFDNNVVNEDITLYAHFNLKELENVNLFLNKTTAYVGEQLTLTVSYDHDLKGSLTTSVIWYKNGLELDTTNSTIYTLNLDKSGSYTYSAKIICGKDTDYVEEATNDVVVKVTYNLSKITVNYVEYGIFEIVDQDVYESTYEVTLYKNGNLLNDFVVNSKEININNYLTESGSYFISVLKKFDGQVMSAVNSETITLFKLQTFVNGEIYSTKYVEADKNIDFIPKVTILGYDFVCWSDIAGNKITFPFEMNNDLNVYASLKIKELNLTTIENVSTNYVYNNKLNIDSKVSHELSNGNYTYNWVKVGDSSFTHTNKELELCYVKDSGEYYCEVIYEVDGNTLTATTNSFIVLISKADTKIDVSNFEDNYIYNGQEQEVKPDIRVLREDEIPNIVYSNNKFTNVPECGYITITVKAEETDNYSQKEITVEIAVHKAQGEITILNDIQSFVYSREKIIPEFTLNNLEQVVDLSNMPINAGEYEEVELIASETQNYKEATAKLKKIIIEKAETVLNLSNIQREFTYNGEEQRIEVGAEVTREDETPNILYSNNTFIDVPESGKLVVVIMAEETNNYKSTTSLFEVYINKAQGVITVLDGEQEFVYLGQNVEPKYEINNLEQVVDFSNMPINVGEYKNVEIVAKESKNYKEAKAIIEKITILKQETFLDISNVLTKYVYNGETQVIGGAFVTRQDELPNITYSTSSFKDVPAGGTISVIITAQETNNYKEATCTVTITVEKAVGEIIINNSIQKFTYSKNKIVPEYSLNNQEQTVDLSLMPKCVGVFANVELIAGETNNYKKAKATIAKIIIQKAKTNIDTSGMQLEYTYNKLVQYISGAKIDRDDEIVDLTYSVSSFLDVPETGILKVTITALETTSYLSATEEVTIKIYKAPTIIDIEQIQKEFTYNGELRFITGAIVDREDEKPVIEYENNSFKDVPEDGKLEVKIIANETKNYSQAIKKFIVKINKAQGEIKVLDNNYIFTYNKKPVEINDYIITNNEQRLENISMPIDAGEYNNFALKTTESKNYISGVVYVNIKIKPAKLKIRVIDESSLWLFAVKDDFSYEVVDGEIFEGDFLNENYDCGASSLYIGSFAINMSILNDNYSVEIIKGTYVVSILPYLAVILSIVALIAIRIVISKNKNNKHKEALKATCVNINLNQPIDTDYKNEKTNTKQTVEKNRNIYSEPELKQVLKRINMEGENSKDTMKQNTTTHKEKPNIKKPPIKPKQQ